MPRLFFMLLASAGLLSADSSAPASLLITYQCAPQDRPALRKAMLDSGVARFQRWREAGVLASFLILFNCHVDTGSWDMLAVLDFADDTKVERWNEIEHRWPAGLAKEELSLMKEVRTDRVDLIHENDSTDPPEKPVFVLTNLEFGEPSEAIRQIEGSLAPEADQRLTGKIISLYRAYLTRTPASEGFLIQEYRNEQAFDESTRGHAAAQRDEAAITEKQSVVAEELGR